MRIKLSLALVLLPAILSAQERFTVKGRIINESGEAVEYVQIGVPKLGIGTISSIDGCFEIELPRDTLEFFHCSYQPESYPVSGSEDDVVIVLKEQELQTAVVIGGNTKEKYLLRPGSKMLGNRGVISFSLRDGHSSGKELGSIANARKPFTVKNIQLNVYSNHVPGCVAAINIYRIVNDDSFVNVLHKPIYFDVALSDEPQTFDIEPEEPILLEPARYFIAFQIVACDEDALQEFLGRPQEERKLWEMTMDFNIYFKSSYLREAALCKMTHLPVNIGIAIKGLEFQ